jgi:MFS family permease
MTFTSLYLGAGVLTPLLVVYKEQWNFQPSMLTLAFAVYAVGFLVAILTLGALSDHIGRRPVLLGALVIQLGSNVVFLFAPDIGWVIVGRIVQGLGTGAASSALTAALVEVAPENRKRLGTILGSVSIAGGLAVGSLLAGLAIQLATAANSIVFIALIVMTILGIVVIALSPETVTRTPGALRSLVPRVSIPSATRREFVAAAPVVAAAWMLAGLSVGLAPSMVRSVFHLDSGQRRIRIYRAGSLGGYRVVVRSRRPPARHDDRYLRLHRRSHRHHRRRLPRGPGGHDPRTGYRRYWLRCLLHGSTAPDLPARGGG